ncbi:MULTISPECIES: malonyl-ACP O-methyltransferase BioC [Providencia]|uniref:Malonyl-[acyl-carrier protein] O-methyltransferase n=1 Tax=Providencia heimbachae ATCC 35613 TaxID=1354272 RepID=A0A1B7JZX7_9GAMM|nr:MULTISPECIES: malonyl-ACP O-methyltransferase BioC [Providencia]MBP6121029.1 malonyl-ACP O-methyltransferase BioC [Providencia sp.]NIH23571.1 malonyl-ACP O-methyltransferase BioC [Providencia heimbachae]OAT53415.1 BioC family biotin synthesis protein [Providencia heimbachae ATCC 35613]QCJ71033.1 malonyl-[acyl-carrier protein] O-methyltransferase BioC [Providencia heimbachae]SQH14151.1 Malonyl-CoA O-methyltransferase BioC [Providencia heimbachae]
MTLLVNSEKRLCHEKQQIASAFGRAAMRYDSLAHYQQNSGRQLLSQLTAELAKQGQTSPRKILDAGCGTGFFSQRMKAQGNEVTALDLSDGMLDIAKQKNAATHYLCADMEVLPFGDEAFDVVFSNLAIQWCRDFNPALEELYRVTKRGGIVAFTTLAENSLGELSQAWEMLDSHSHVNSFLSYQGIIDNCSAWRTQLALQQDTLYFANIYDLLNSLKGIGATHLTAGRKAGLMTRQRLQQLDSVYPATEQGLPLTYHTVFGLIYRD